MDSVAIILWLLHKIVYTFSSNTILNVYTICLTHPRKITPYYKKHCKVTENRPWIHITTPYPRTLHPGKILDLGLVFVSMFKKKNALSYFMSIFKKKIISSTNCIIQTNDSLMFKCISKYKILYTNKQRTLSISALNKPAQYQCTVFGAAKKRCHIVYMKENWMFKYS